MSLSSQAKTFGGGRGAKKFVFQDGVRYRHMTGKDPVIFRILPAFNPANPDKEMSWLPSIDPSGNLTDWAFILKVVRYVGHADFRSGGRQDLISLHTFDDETTTHDCPLDRLYNCIREDPATWGYLIKDKGEKNDPNRVSAAYGRVQGLLVANILDLAAAQDGVKLGVFTTGATQELIDPEEGLVFTPNCMPNLEAFIAQDYMNRYANGDITHPGTGACLNCMKGTKNGEMSGYKISIATNSQNRSVIRKSLDRSQMGQRYNLASPANVINAPTEESLVQALVGLLNGRSPDGYHEYALLRLVFPQHRIPEPPAAPAASSTVQSGFGTSPAAQHQQVAAQPRQAEQAPNWVAPTSQATVQAQQAAPVQQAVQTATPDWGQPAATQASPQPQHPAEVRGVQANAAKAASAAVQAAPQEPMAPGDPIPTGFDKNAFLAKVRAQGG